MTSAAEWRTLVDLGRLSTWMDERKLASGPLEDPVRLAGGTQNLLLRFRRGDREFVLRRPSAELREVGGKTIAREARMLKALAGSRAPHAALIAACDDKTVLGAKFYLMESVDGFNPNSAAGLPLPYAGDPDMRRHMGLAMVDALLCLHELDYRAIGLDGFGRPDGFHQRQVARWLHQLDSVAGYAG